MLEKPTPDEWAAFVRRAERAPAPTDELLDELARAFALADDPAQHERAA